MSLEREAVVWCPKCRENKFEVLRVPTGADGVHHHVTEPKERAGMKHCECGAILERKA